MCRILAIVVWANAGGLALDVELSDPACVWQVFVDVDNDPDTGYGAGFELVARGLADDFMLRETEPPGGMNGWGGAVACLDHRGQPSEGRPAAHYPLPARPVRFRAEAYADGVWTDAREGWTRDGEVLACLDEDADCDTDLRDLALSMEYDALEVSACLTGPR